MSAYRFSKHGDPTEVLEKVTVPTPTPTSTQVLLKVHAVALNPAGYKAIHHFPSFMIKKPGIPEFDISGTVVGIGPDVKRWKIGDEVFGILNSLEVFRTGQGALAEYTLAREQFLYRKPSFLSWEEASSISLTALTAYQNLCKDPKTPLSKGQSIFINGGSGGVGLYAIQIARYIVGETGKVVVSCSAGNHELVKQYGADEAVDYTSVDLPSYLSQEYSATRFDLVLDAVGSFDLFYASAAFLKPRGECVLIVLDIPSSLAGFMTTCVNLTRAYLQPAFLGGVPRRFKLTLLKFSEDGMQNVGRLVDQKEIKPVLDSIWEFNDEGVKDAYRKIMTGHAKGKVVIRVSN